MAFEVNSVPLSDTIAAKKIGRRTVILIPTLLAEIEGRRTGP
jgi:hypothetical protein